MMTVPKMLDSDIYPRIAFNITSNEDLNKLYRINEVRRKICANILIPNSSSYDKIVTFKLCSDCSINIDDPHNVLKSKPTKQHTVLANKDLNVNQGKFKTGDYGEINNMDDVPVIEEHELAIDGELDSLEFKKQLPKICKFYPILIFHLNYWTNEAIWELCKIISLINSKYPKHRVRISVKYQISHSNIPEEFIPHITNSTISGFDFPNLRVINRFDLDLFKTLKSIRVPYNFDEKPSKWRFDIRLPRLETIEFNVKDFNDNSKLLDFFQIYAPSLKRIIINLFKTTTVGFSLNRVLDRFQSSKVRSIKIVSEYNYSRVRADFHLAQLIGNFSSLKSLHINSKGINFINKPKHDPIFPYLTRLKVRNNDSLTGLNDFYLLNLTHLELKNLENFNGHSFFKFTFSLTYLKISNCESFSFMKDLEFPSLKTFRYHCHTKNHGSIIMRNLRFPKLTDLDLNLFSRQLSIRNIFTPKLLNLTYDCDREDVVYLSNSLLEYEQIFCPNLRYLGISLKSVFEIMLMGFTFSKNAPNLLKSITIDSFEKIDNPECVQACRSIYFGNLPKLDTLELVSPIFHPSSNLTD